MVEAASYNSLGDRFGELSAKPIIGACDGSILRNSGLPGIPAGNSPRTTLIAACTSRAASSKLRSRSKVNTTWVEPWLLDDEIEVMPLILPKARSSGVATVLAILSGLAPGKLAVTLITGKSTCGRGATGSNRQANKPTSTSAKDSKPVATGR